MEPLEFLDVAKELHDSGDEAKRRTSIGRAYFALFNYLRAKVSPVRPVPQTDDAHRAVAYYLTEANNQRLRRIGQSLHNLRSDRNRADYELGENVGTRESQAAVRRAERAVDLVDHINDQTLQTAVQRVPRYQRN